MTFKEFKSLVNEYNKANNKNITVNNSSIYDDIL